MSPPDSAAAPALVIDPETAEILAAARQNPPPDYPNLPLAEGRRTFVELSRVWNDPLPALAVVRDLTLPGPAGTLTARFYAPRAGAKLPVQLYLHGGGWTFGSVDSHDRAARLIAQDAGIAVLSLDYRLSPETPFPGARDDALAALRWIASGALGGDVDPARVAVGGDSAGANLALCTMIGARDGGAPLPRTATLIYGCYAPVFDTPSNRRYGRDFLLTTERMRWFWANYLGGADPAKGGGAPLNDRLGGLPPLYLNAAGLDPLLDDSILMAGRLAEAGVPYRLDVHPGVVHGFMQQTAKVARARTAMAAIADHLKRTLAN